MIEMVNRLEQLLSSGLAYVSESSELELAKKPSPTKWSKREILGHLVDSGINNLQRFTEIQFENRPYQVRKYRQDELVKANDYQHTATEVVVDLWLSVNKQIMNVIARQTDATLSYEVTLGEGQMVDLKFLMTDYIDHLEHHLHQIIEQK